MLEKTARKPSSDPIQEKLRQNKAQWNKDVSAFVNNLIHLKKMMNGWPSKFFKQRSRIADPIPADPVTIIGSLAGDFQELAQRGNAIVEEQINYSKNRKKKQPKQPTAPTTSPTTAPAAPTAPATPESSTPEPTTPAPDLSKQLSAFEKKYELVAEASNPVTRFFARLLNPTIGVSEAARIRRFRMSLLSACVKAYKDLGKAQVEVVKSSPESIIAANQKLQQAWNNWILVARGFQTYKLNMPPVVEDTGGDIAPPEELVEEKEKQEKSKKVEEKAERPIHHELKDDYEAEERTPLGDDVVPAPPPPPDYSSNEVMVLSKSIINDYKKSLTANNFPDDPIFSNLNNIIGKFMMSPAAGKSAWAVELLKEYRQVISQLNSKYGTNGVTLAQIASARDAKKVDKKASAQIEVVAQDFLKKWIGKTKHQLSLFDKTSSYRLDIYKLAEDLRKSIDKIMDSLEKDMNVEELDPLISDVNRKMTTIRGLMRALYYSSGQEHGKGLRLR